MCQERVWAQGQENVACPSTGRVGRLSYDWRVASHLHWSLIKEATCPELTAWCLPLYAAAPRPRPRAKWPRFGHRAGSNSQQKALQRSGAWPDVVCPPSGSSGAQPRKWGLPSQPPASPSKSHCSRLGRARPNLPPWPWGPLHPLSIQNQFIWVIFKAQHSGQLELADSSRPNAWGFFQPRAYVLRVLASAPRYGQHSERGILLTRLSSNFPSLEQAESLICRRCSLAPRGRSLSSAAEHSSSRQAGRIRVSGAGPGSLAAEAKSVSWPLEK